MGQSTVTLSDTKFSSVPYQVPLINDIKITFGGKGFSKQVHIICHECLRNVS